MDAHQVHRLAHRERRRHRPLVEGESAGQIGLHSTSQLTGGTMPPGDPEDQRGRRLFGPKELRNAKRTG
jgi:hypothetical protein